MAEINKVTLGISQINKIYLGENLVWKLEEPDIVTPTTTIYPDPILSYDQGQKFWFEVDETCKTYYTLDGTEPTINSTLFTEAIVLNNTTTLKYFSVDLAGNVESVKTTTITIIIIPVTTISPTNVTQNTIPFTVTLSATNNPTATYYKLGATGTQKTYTVPFSVNQNSAGVNSTNIKVTYWSVNANGTETENVITYNTSGSIPAKPNISVTNNDNQVVLDWAVTANTTSYTIFRSTEIGQLGTMLAQYISPNTYTDNTAIGGTTYYYTVQAGNYGTFTNSDQATALPTLPYPYFRYLKVEGYGATEVGQTSTTRFVELEAWEGATNRMTNATMLSSDLISGGSTDLNTLKDGIKATTYGTYPVWWTTTPNANVIIDLGAFYPLTKLNYYGYSTASVNRANRFNIFGSNTNNGTDWVEIWNMQNNTTMQGALPAGYEKIL